MTTIDPYTSLTNQEFLRLHGDRIPEDLLPRIEVMVKDIEELEEYIIELEDMDIPGCNFENNDPNRQ